MLNYAIIKDKNVVNIAYSEHPLNENWIFLEDTPVHIGDTYDGEFFYRNGRRVISKQEYLQIQLTEAQTANSILLGEVE